MHVRWGRGGGHDSENLGREQLSRGLSRWQWSLAHLCPSALECPSWPRLYTLHPYSECASHNIPFGH